MTIAAMRSPAAVGASDRDPMAQAEHRRRWERRVASGLQAERRACIRKRARATLAKPSRGRPAAAALHLGLIKRGRESAPVLGAPVSLEAMPGISALRVSTPPSSDFWRIASLPAILVKLSDNEDDADADRMAKLAAATRARLLAKYESSMAMLREDAQPRGWEG
ncbi:hypothetical protein [Methylobacterium sp. WL120]|uniref:hypothetical protein n=1 Tax=Methylobacterium sp. WL120 TaxID=2603887 RepID=UPI0011C8483E|nr:hypothetical protein [Methylobacterium sp. WL120]TXM64652.1 hypothetical protein FV229_17850 [Methylobacterium sp. WL120]